MLIPCRYPQRCSRATAVSNLCVGTLSGVRQFADLAQGSVRAMWLFVEPMGRRFPHHPIRTGL
jgi:hypothetical protein